MKMILQTRNLLCHLGIVIFCLLVAEVLGMALISPLMKQDKAYVVILGLLALPLWAVLIALVYTADRRVRTLGVLLSLASVAGILLFVTV